MKMFGNFIDKAFLLHTGLAQGDCHVGVKTPPRNDITHSYAGAGRPPRDDDKGRSMIEMLGVLAIIGALSVGGIAGYTKAMWQYKINKDIEIITQTVTNMQTLFASQTGNCKYGGEYGCEEDIDGERWCQCTSDWNFPLAIREQVFPDGLEYIDEYFYRLPSGARIGLWRQGLYNNYNEVNMGGTNQKAFEIVPYGLSKKECIALATYNWGSRTTGLIGYSVAESWISDTGYNPDATYNCQGQIGGFHAPDVSENSALACPGGSVVGVPMPFSVAANACANCDDLEEGCVMEFIFE